MEKFEVDRTIRLFKIPGSQCLYQPARGTRMGPFVTHGSDLIGLRPAFLSYVITTDWML